MVVPSQGSRFREGLDFGFVSLDIMYVYPADEGTYTCRATNLLGQAVTTANLQVRVQKTIQKETIHQAAMAQINYLEQAHIRQNQDEGFVSQAPQFTHQMRECRVNEGTSAHFEAKLMPVGDPNLTVEWYKDGQPIQASNRLSTLHDFGFVALDLKYTRQDDGGTYTCVARNNLGEANISAPLTVQSAKDGPNAETLHGDAMEKIAYLEQRRHTRRDEEEEGVTSAPQFVVALRGKTNLIEGQNAHLECRLEPYPDQTLQVEWFHNGKPLPFGNKWRTSFDFGFAALNVIGAYPEDSGRYTLKATNCLGTAESSVDIRIARKLNLVTVYLISF